MSLRYAPLWLFVTTALCAFAANSLLARAALEAGAMDPVSFTAIRILSGAATLWAIVAARGDHLALGDVDWRAAAALFGYALFFSLGYVTIEAGIGALILFGAVQTTMIGAGLLAGERTSWLGALGVALAMGGVVGLLAPGAGAPDALGLGLMVISGACWGVYSLIGRGAADPTRATALNFLAAAPMALGVSAIAAGSLQTDIAGVALAVLSGALASGCGYVLWYAALPYLSAIRAAVLMLGTPALTAAASIALLGEPLTWRLLAAAAAILGGLGLYLSQRQR